jgi:hypothetical protein
MRRKGDPRPVALDHNFPETIVRAVMPYMPEVRFRWVREIDERLPDLDDHDLVYELHRVGFSVMVSDDYKLRSDPRVLVAVEQTRMTLLTIEGAGDDPILATGVLLRDLMPVLRGDIPKGMIYKIKPTTLRGVRARKLADELEDGKTYEDHQHEHGRPFISRNRYPEGDPRRVV